MHLSAFGTAGEIADAVRTRRVSATEVLESTLARVDRLNPSVNAIVWADPDEALGRARRLDDSLASGQPPGALHGVPVTIKEAFAYRGSPSTWGLPALKGAVSSRTAVAIERLEAAGAVVVGKTNVPVLLGDWQSYNPVYGTTNNPWDLARTPGGSTGGGAAAVATGLGALAMGSDLNGSLRIPAHFCGVYGHKPSLGLVSPAGFQPGAWDGSPGYVMDLGVVGPLARSARDLELAMTVLGGPHGEKARAWSWRLPPGRHSRLKDFRIGCVLDDALAPIAGELRATYDAVVAALRKAGASVEMGWPAGVDLGGQMRTFGYLLGAFLAADLDEAARDRARARYKRHPDDVFAAATVEPHGRWLKETQARLQYRAIWQRYFERHDVFLLPASVTAAFAHDHSEPIDGRRVQTAAGPRPYIQAIPYWTAPATLAGIPATVAPVGRTAAGLPVGLQVLAPMWEDGTSMTFADRLADLVGGFHPPPDP